MNTLLEVLLNGNTLEEALEDSARARQEMVGRKAVRTFKVTHNHGFITTEIYPNQKQSDLRPSNDCRLANEQVG